MIVQIRAVDATLLHMFGRHGRVILPRHLRWLTSSQLLLLQQQVTATMNLVEGVRL